MNGILQLLRNLGPAKLLAIALATAGTIAFFYYLANRIDTPEMGLLFSGLDLKDSSHIVQKLETMNVPYQLHDDGSQVLVPVDQVMKLRMSLAEQGLPEGGSVGYEIFDKTNSFGPSQFVENIDRLRALEGELERTIDSLSMVQSSRVHVVLPERALFSRRRQQASASIVLKMRGVGRPSREQIAAIQHLVAAAVPDLDPNRVSIVDDQGDLLANGDGDQVDALTSANAEKMQIDYENRMARRLERLLDRSLGPGKARVDVHAEMDFARVVTNSEIYDPDSQVVRSTQTDKRTDESGIPPSQAVSVTSNLPSGQTAPGKNNGNGDNKESKSTHDEETVNYEISKTVKNQISDQGRLKRLSVAVLVDGTTTTGPNGKKTYQPRSPQEMKQLTALVRTAVGYDAKRGDTVEVVNLPFAGVAPPPPPPTPWSLMGLDKADLVYLGATAGTALIGLLILLLVVKPMIGRFLESAATAASAAPALVGPANAAALPAPAGVPAVAGATSARGEMIDIGQVDGRVAASSIKKIGEIVEKHPEEAVAIVRSWMYQDK